MWTGIKLYIKQTLGSYERASTNLPWSIAWPTSVVMHAKNWRFSFFLGLGFCYDQGLLNVQSRSNMYMGNKKAIMKKRVVVMPTFFILESTCYSFASVHLPY